MYLLLKDKNIYSQKNYSANRATPCHTVPHRATPATPCHTGQSLNYSISSISAGAMQAMVSKGIVHRDLKPQNILLSHEGRTKNPLPQDITLKIG